MSRFERQELEEMWRRWIEANDRAEAENDWSHLGPFYAEDAAYHWKVGHTHQFRAEGRQQIADYVMRFEMLGFDDWKYPYEKVVIDDQRGEIVGYWAPITPFREDDGRPYRIAALGVSWFQYGGDCQWTEQLDVFDSQDIAGLIGELGKAGLMTEDLKKRLAIYAEGKAPGTTRLS